MKSHGFFSGPGEKGVTFKQEIAAGLPAITLDEKRIGQVISNLLANAIRYTPAGGTVECRGENEQRGNYTLGQGYG